MKTQAIDFSFLNAKAETIELPSRGLPYDKKSPLSKGTIRIKPWTTAIEKIIDRFSTGNYFQVIADMVKASVVEDIDVNELTDSDLAFILYWARAYTYGSTYNIETTCPECGSKIRPTIDINNFELTYLDHYDETFDVDVPLSPIKKKDNPVIKMKMRLPRVGDLIKVNSMKRSDLNKIGIKVDNEVHRYALCTLEMIFPNEEKTIWNPETIPNYVNASIKKVWNELPAFSILAIQEAIDTYKHGYITPFRINCPECGNAIDQMPALDYTFFRPSRNEAGDIAELPNDIQ